MVAVEAAAAEGLKRVVITSTISAIGPATNGRPANEQTEYPRDWLGLAYPDSKHEGELAALEAGDRHGIQVVVVNPAYLLGVPVDREQPGETSTRTVGNYLRRRLPGVIDAPMNFADVADAAAGHLLAADKGRPGERYILGGENMSWPELIQHVADVSGRRHPVLVLPPETARVAQIREAMKLPAALPAEGFGLMSKDWRFSSEKAKRQLGYTSRPIDETIKATVDQENVDRWTHATRLPFRLRLTPEGVVVSTGVAGIRVGEVEVDLTVAGPFLRLHPRRATIVGLPAPLVRVLRGYLPLPPLPRGAHLQRVEPGDGELAALTGGYHVAFLVGAIFAAAVRYRSSSAGTTESASALVSKPWASSSGGSIDVPSSSTPRRSRIALAYSVRFKRCRLAGRPGLGRRAASRSSSVSSHVATAS